MLYFNKDAFRHPRIPRLTRYAKYSYPSPHIVQITDFLDVLHEYCEEQSETFFFFFLRAVRLSSKLLGQGYVKERLKYSLRKLYGRYGDLTKQYEVPLSRMLHDILEDNDIQWHPPLMRHYTNFWPFTDLDLISEFDFWPNCVKKNICNGCGMPTEDAYSSGHLILSPFGRACVLMSRPISPELVLFPDFWTLNIPRYFCLTFTETLHRFSLNRKLILS